MKFSMNHEFKLICNRSFFVTGQRRHRRGRQEGLRDRELQRPHGRLRSVPEV